MDEDEVGFLAVTKPSGKSPLKVPETNEQFVYTVGRALSFWPTVNGNGATWLESDIASLYSNKVDSNLTWRGKLVNANHEIGAKTQKMVIGTTIAEAFIPGVGVDVLNQLDRRQLKAYQMEANEFAAETGEYSKQSIEIRCDRSKSKFIAVLNPGNADLATQKVFTAEEAAALGMRRTTDSDPQGKYLYENKYNVVEAGFPKRVWGIGILSKPQADASAVIYDIAASQDYANMDDLQKAYQDTAPTSLGDDIESSLPNDAFAICNDCDESMAKGSTTKRELPLYESKHRLDNQSPHAGLIKTAVDKLNGSDKTKYSPALHAEANKRVRNAHKQISQGDKKMALTADEKAALVDPLENEIAGLKKTIKTKTDEQAEIEKSKVLELQAKDNEIAAIKTENDKLKAKIAADESALLVETRLAELSKVEGFEIKADEKAELLAKLSTEAEPDFRVRVLSAKNASLEKKLAAGSSKTPDEIAALKIKEKEDEIAALKGLNIDKADLKKLSIYAFATK